MTCHRDGGVAPFPLETYDQVFSKRSALVYSLETDTMPPLGFADLADADRQLLIDWANNGAPKGDPSQVPEPAPVSVYTYHADIRPLLDKHCIGCHVEGGIAPFPLDTFDDVRGVSAAIAYSLEQGTMPPWPPTTGYTRIENDRLLSDEEKYVFLTWLASDMPEGNSADYQPSASGPVDDPDNYNLKLQLPQPYTPIVQPDDHRCFAIEWPEDEFTYVTGVSVIPDQEEEVHHVIVSVAEPEDAATYYAEDGKDGYPGWYCLYRRAWGHGLRRVPSHQSVAVGARRAHRPRRRRARRRRPRLRRGPARA